MEQDKRYRRLKNEDYANAGISNIVKGGEAKKEKPKYGEAGSYRYSEVPKTVSHKNNFSVLSFIKKVNTKRHKEWV